MAINETIASGKYRQCIDEINKIWKRYSLWNKASDTECEDGQTVEEKVGTIKGITTDENVTESGYAADMIALNELRAQLYSEMIPASVVTQAEYNALGSGRPQKLYVIVG